MDTFYVIKEKTEQGLKVVLKTCLFEEEQMDKVRKFPGFIKFLTVDQAVEENINNFLTVEQKQLVKESVDK